jgi:flagellar assembly protein FliH
MLSSPWLVPKSGEPVPRDLLAGTGLAPRMARVITAQENPTITAMNWKLVEPVGRNRAPKTAETQPDRTGEIAQLKQEWEQRVREAHAAGVREGEAAGRTRGAAEVQPVVERLARTIEELTQMRPRLRKEAESDTVQLSLAIARRVLRRELAVDPDAMRGLVMSALEKLQGHEISRVKVHPAHAAQVSAVLRTSSHNAAVEVIPDPSCEPGGIVFETTRGDLDASVDSQLQEIERGLTDRLRKL